MPRNLTLLVVLASCASAPHHGAPTPEQPRPGPGPASQASIAEGEHVRLPAWARLAGVLGSYDMRHSDVVAAMFSDDSQHVISVGDSGMLRVWSVREQALERTIEACAGTPGPTTRMRSQVLALSATFAITGDARGDVCVRDWTRGTVVRTWHAHDVPIRFIGMRGPRLITYAHQKRVVSEAQIGPILEQDEAGGEARTWDLGGARGGELAIGDSDALVLSPGGSTLVVALGGKLRGLDPDTGRVRWTRDLVPECEAEHWFPCEPRLAFADDGTLVVAFPHALASVAPDGVHRFAFHGFWSDQSRPFSALAVSRDGHAFAVTDDGLVTFWDVGERMERNDGQRATARDIRGAAYAPDGARVVSWADGVLQLWDATARVRIPRPAGHEHKVTRVVVADNGRALTVSDLDLEARVWDVPARKTLARWEALDGEGDLSRDGALAITVAMDQAAELRDATTARVLSRIPDRTRSGSARFSPDGAQIVTQGREGHELLAAHDTKTGRLLWQEGKGVYSGRPVLAITSDAVIALDEQHRLTRWSRDGKRLGPLGGPADPRDFAIDPAGVLAVTRGEGLTLHDLATASAKRFADGGWYGLAMTGDGRLFAVQYDGTVHAYAVASGADLGAIDLAPTQDRGSALALSPDGTQLYIGTERGVVLIVDLVKGQTQAGLAADTRKIE